MNCDAIKFDNIVFCVGRKSNDFELADQYLEKVITVGDANKPGKVIDAVWDAYRKIRLI